MMYSPSVASLPQFLPFLFLSICWWAKSSYSTIRHHADLCVERRLLLNTDKHITDLQSALSDKGSVMHRKPDWSSAHDWLSWFAEGSSKAITNKLVTSVSSPLLTCFVLTKDDNISPLDSHLKFQYIRLQNSLQYICCYEKVLSYSHS